MNDFKNVLRSRPRISNYYYSFYLDFILIIESIVLDTNIAVGHIRVQLVPVVIEALSPFSENF
jgi:hypothetical protein